MISPITIGGGKGKRQSAILTPAQYHAIESKLNADYKIRSDFLLETGFRLSEARWVDENRNAFKEENMAIFLRRVEDLGKKRCTIDNRAVLLTPKGVRAVKLFFEKNVHLPSYQAMDLVFKRAARDAGIDPTHYSPKSLRKTRITWLMVAYQNRMMQIANSVGHDLTTMQGHYLGSGWRLEDKKEMIKEVEGWSGA